MRKKKGTKRLRPAEVFRGKRERGQLRSYSSFLLDYRVARCAGTPATVMRTCGGPTQALRASRSDQFHRSCERTARGGRGGGERGGFPEARGRISTYCPRQ